jgi:uncharacterized protein YlxP (DUF503 family)
MIIGLLTIEIYIPYSHSLKEKRKTLNKIKDRVKNKFNVAFAELDYLNKWQRSKIGMVTINTQKNMVDKVFHRIVKEIEENIEGEIIKKDIYFF